MPTHLNRYRREAFHWRQHDVP